MPCWLELQLPCQRQTEQNRRQNSTTMHGWVGHSAQRQASSRNAGYPTRALRPPGAVVSLRAGLRSAGGCSAAGGLGWGGGGGGGPRAGVGNKTRKRGWGGFFEKLDGGWGPFF